MKYVWLRVSIMEPYLPQDGAGSFHEDVVAILLQLANIICSDIVFVSLDELPVGIVMQLANLICDNIVL